MRSTPDLLSRAIASLEERGEAIPPEMRHALHGMMLRQWVHLKDFGKPSVFLDPAGE